MKAIELIFFALYSSCLIWIMKFFPFLTDFNFSPVFRDLMLTWVKNGAQDISTTLCSIWLIFLHKILVTLLHKMSHGIRDILIFHWTGFPRNLKIKFPWLFLKNILFPLTFEPKKHTISPDFSLKTYLFPWLLATFLYWFNLIKSLKKWIVMCILYKFLDI